MKSTVLQKFTNRKYFVRIPYPVGVDDILIYTVLSGSIQDKYVGLADYSHLFQPTVDPILASTILQKPSVFNGSLV